MPLTIHLLGRPHLEAAGAEAYRFRSQKSWALLAYLVLADDAPTRAQVAGLLFDTADDPLRALRWSLAEVRRGLGDSGVIDGDPLRLELASGTTVDTRVLTGGSWQRALALPGLGRELLESHAIRGSHAFDVWLTAERRRLAASAEAVLHEAALGLMSEGDMDAAIDAAVRVVAMNPLDENSQALLIRLYRRAGDLSAARSAYDAAARVLRDELDVDPGPAIISAWRDQQPSVKGAPIPARAAVQALVESGSAAVAAGVTDVGLASLRTAVGMADASTLDDLQVDARLTLAETLIHSVRGMDEEGIGVLHDADALAAEQGRQSARAQIRTELGYVDFLRARYDRAEHWLSDALSRAGDDSAVVGQVRICLGAVESDRADYSRALEDLAEGAHRMVVAGNTRREAYALSLIGRLHLLRGEWDAAEETLEKSVSLCESGRWLSLMPWPQALLGELRLARGDVAGAEELLDQAFARACRLGDPCWEGTAARALALAAAERGNLGVAFERLDEARIRSRRVSDAYVWLDAYILDARCTLGLRSGHPDTAQWVQDMQELAERTDMREMAVRARVHGARLGREHDADLARLLAPSIDNPDLHRLVESL